MSTFILHKVHQALQEYLEAKEYTVEPNVYKGMEHETVAEGLQPKIALPAVTISAQRAEQDPPFSNNWTVDVSVAVRTNADDNTDASHETMADEVFAHIYDDGIAAELSGLVDNFTVFLLVPGEQTFAVVERSWVSTFEFQLHCAGADIA